MPAFTSASKTPMVSRNSTFLELPPRVSGSPCHLACRITGLQHRVVVRVNGGDAADHPVDDKDFLAEAEKCWLASSSSRGLGQDLGEHRVFGIEVEVETEWLPLREG